MKEDSKNYEVVCPKHAPRPQTKYFSWTPSDFIGKWIKTEFSEINTGRKEHIWIKVQTITGNQLLKGVVDNDPLLNLGLTYGDIVEVSIDKIESCFDGKNVL